MGKPKKSTKKFRAKKITHKKHHNAPKKKEVEKMKVEKPDQVDTVTPGENLGNVTVDEVLHDLPIEIEYYCSSWMRPSSLQLMELANQR